MKIHRHCFSFVISHTRKAEKDKKTNKEKATKTDNQKGKKKKQEKAKYCRSAIHVGTWIYVNRNHTLGSAAKAANGIQASRRRAKFSY